MTGEALAQVGMHQEVELFGEPALAVCHLPIEFQLHQFREDARGPSLVSDEFGEPTNPSCAEGLPSND